MGKYKGPERRKHPRLNANFIVSYKIIEPPSDFDLSQTKDVSQGGLFLTTNKGFEQGTLLSMTIRFPFASDKLKLTGQVVNSEEKVKNLLYETHIQFKDSDEAFLKKIGNFINKELDK
ncbi:MAG: PilZ domain-containing protein [Candidatus Omnitrophica bacterium]|nr:PilZ domain-containing protein [Candidatus Omnitrophota bacterium]MCF7894459.1 PilZ domain-containing protein [Candidatus Omnitrophota bacterium]